MDENLTGKSQIGQLTESSLIKIISNYQSIQNNVIKGIGDDTAVVECCPHGDDYLLLTQDSLISGRHFELDNTDPAKVGWKALARNISDIASMGGKPLWITVGLALPDNLSAQWLDNFYKGMKNCADKFGCSIIGGDLSSSAKEVFISLALAGKVNKNNVKYRSGAVENDYLCVTGTLGGSILGKHLDFSPRVYESIWLIENLKVTAMIDLSDGIAKDLFHIAEAGNIGFELEYERIPVSDAAYSLAGENQDIAIDHALNDGEDYELLFTVSGEKNIIEDKLKEFTQKFSLSCKIIGRAVEDCGKIKIIKENKFLYELLHGGYNHFGC